MSSDIKMSYEEGYIFGKNKEEDVFKIIKEYFNNNIKQYLNRYDKFDFYDDKTNYELKSRTFESTKYKSTMIHISKLISKKNIILLFNFTDVLTCIQYNKEQFKDYKIDDRYNNIYIPIKDLTIIQTYAS